MEGFAAKPPVRWPSRCAAVPVLGARNGTVTRGRTAGPRQPGLVHACAMQLHYLDFDFSDEDTGRGSFDAMASVLPERLPALLGEIAAVLGWAIAAFGPSGALEEEGEWGYELQGTIEPGTALKVAYDEASSEVTLSPAGATARTTLTLTLSGSPAFCDAFKESFESGD